MDPKPHQHMLDRKHFLAALERRLDEYFLGFGFDSIPLSREERGSPEFSRAFPLGRYTRIVKHEVHIVEPQVDKRGLARCRVNFGVLSLAGAVDLPEAVSGRDLRVRILHEYGELYQSALFKRWFSPSLWGAFPVTKSDADEMFDRMVKALPEIQNWFDTKVVGKHLIIVDNRP